VNIFSDRASWRVGIKSSKLKAQSSKLKAQSSKAKVKGNLKTKQRKTGLLLFSS
jgi:hypothetical protein